VFESRYHRNPRRFIGQGVDRLISPMNQLRLSISSTLAYYCTQNNHLDKTEMQRLEMQRHALEIIIIFKIYFGSKRDIGFSTMFHFWFQRHLQPVVLINKWSNFKVNFQFIIMTTTRVFFAIFTRNQKCLKL
jgi:hypothetical protein